MEKYKFGRGYIKEYKINIIEHLRLMREQTVERWRIPDGISRTITHTPNLTTTTTPSIAMSVDPATGYTDIFDKSYNII